MDEVGQISSEGTGEWNYWSDVRAFGSMTAVRRRELLPGCIIERTLFAKDGLVLLKFLMHSTVRGLAR